MRYMKKVSVLIVATVLALIFVPMLCTNYMIRVINYALFGAILAYGISILLGMGGQLSFASIAFMGIGAFVIANLCTDRLGLRMAPMAALLIAVASCIILGFLMGLVLFKLKGTFFTFGTIAVVSMAYTFFLNYKPLFGGAEGISNIASFSVFGYTLTENSQWFVLLLILTLLTALAVERIRVTKLGRSLASIRDNETAAKTLGVNVYKTKVYAFTIAAGLAGLSGALYAFQGNYAVSDMFTYDNATTYIIMCMLGGVNNSVGILIGSLLVKIVPEVFRQFDRYVQFFWGVLIVLLMIFMPDGVMGLLQSLARKLRRRDKAVDSSMRDSGANR